MSSSLLTRRRMLKLCATNAAATVVLPGNCIDAAPRLSAAVTEKCRTASKLLADYLTELAAGAKRRVGNGLIFPLAGDSEKQSIVRFFRDNRAKLFLRGCTRQIAEPGGWEGNVNPGRYQNGGFWATGTGYVLPALAQLDPALCVELLEDLTANLSKIDFAEWLDATGKPNGAMKFLASLALPLMGLNSILQDKPLIEYF
jgi:hypothetical protein